MCRGNACVIDSRKIEGADASSRNSVEKFETNRIGVLEQQLPLRVVESSFRIVFEAAELAFHEGQSPEGALAHL